MTTFIAFLAVIGVGTIIAAFVGHLTAISNFRQAWINTLRNDLAEFFRALEKLYYTFGDYKRDSARYEEQWSKDRIALLFVYERIRLLLNRTENLHVQLEKKLGEFLDEPLDKSLSDRSKIDEAVDLARQLLKYEWDVTKHPWKGY